MLRLTNAYVVNCFPVKNLKHSEKITIICAHLDAMKVKWNSFNNRSNISDSEKAAIRFSCGFLVCSRNCSVGE